MAHLLVRHKVQDYLKWKEVYDKHSEARAKAGCKTARLYRTPDDANQVLVFCEWDGLENARRFADSASLREAMNEGGVIGRPEFVFLEQASEEFLRPESEQVAKILFESFNAHDLEKALSIFSEESEWFDVPSGRRFKGKDGFREYYSQWLDLFPDAHIEMQNQMIAGDQVLIEYLGTGTDKKSGKKAELCFCDAFRVKNGKIARGNTYYDALSLLRQLGTPQKSAA